MLLRSTPRASLLLASALAAAGCGDKKAPRPTASPSASAATLASAPAAASPGRCSARGPHRVARASRPGASSAVELVRASGRLVALVADPDEQALHAVDAASLRQIGVTPLPGRPGHVLALSDGTVAVAIRDRAQVLFFEPSSPSLEGAMTERCTSSVAAEPIALAEAAARLLVASGVGAALSTLAPGDRSLVREVPLLREPRALLSARQGKLAIVSHMVGGQLSLVDLEAPDQPPATVGLMAGLRSKPDGEPDKTARTGTQGFALAAQLSADERQEPLRVFAPHTSVDPGTTDTEPTSGYGTSLGNRAIAPVVSVIDVAGKKSLTRDAVRSHGSGLFQQDCLLPRGAVVDEKSLFVACANLDAVLDLDPDLYDPIEGERRRIAVPAGPAALALADDGSLFVFSEFDRAISRVDRQSGAASATPLWRRAGQKRDPLIDRGRKLFHATRDVRIAKGRACASCHPDGRDDGLSWSSPDGIRQTLTLAGRLEGTGPYGWFGEHATLKKHLASTFARLGGTGLDQPAHAADLDALLAYVASLPPLPLAAPQDAAAVARGKEIFSSRCDNCHKNGGTNGLAYDVGSGSKKERKAQFDTPSLRGIRASAPYFHDGRYASLLDVLSATDNRMIPEPPLSEPEKKSLIAYLETL